MLPFGYYWGSRLDLEEGQSCLSPLGMNWCERDVRISMEVPVPVGCLLVGC